MILRRLYELAERERLLEDPAFKTAPVACLINIGPAGEYLGILDLRPREEIASKKEGMPGKVRVGRGKPMSVPVRPVVMLSADAEWKTTDAAAKGGPAVFLADTLPRVLPVEPIIAEADRKKFQSQRATFWRFIAFAAEQTGDDALSALGDFEKWLQEDPATEQRLADDAEARGLDLRCPCTFAWSPDEGRPLLERAAIRDWWRRFYDADLQAKHEAMGKGFCQVIHREAPITKTIKVRIHGLTPIGCRAEAYIVSSLPASESYGLPRTCSAMVSERGVDGFSRALDALIGNQLHNRPQTSLRLSSSMFLFWTRQPTPEFDPAGLLERPDPDDIQRLLKSVTTGQAAPVIHPEQFYCLMLNGNSARVVVRNYIETTIPMVQRNLARWFADLRIFDPGSKETTSAFPLWMLAAATVRDMRDLAPQVPSVLLTAAIHNRPLPDSTLGACIRRLGAEGGSGFRPARLALIKLVLNRTHLKENPMSEELDPKRGEPAYLCGRLLAVFERIQWAAMGDLGATVVDRFYGTAGTAPTVVFPRLFKLAQQHLSKLADVRRGQAVNLQKDLETITSDLADFPQILSLPQQGQFALGFYHQRSAYRQQAAERKAGPGGPDGPESEDVSSHHGTQE